jgi:anti-anti-sigma factor
VSQVLVAVYRGSVRASGLLSEPAGVEDADHVCWAYRDDAAFEEAAVRFLRAGLDRGERLMWVGDGAAERLRHAGGEMGHVDQLTARGALELVPVADGYATAGPFSPQDQLAFYDARTRQARTDGYTGLRVVAEVTALASDAEHSTAFLQWEHLADDFVASGAGFSAFCAYSVADLPAQVVGDAVAVHPVASVPGVPPAFRLWFEPDEQGQRIAVAGEVDVVGADRFRRLVDSTHVDTPVLTLDLSRVTFIDLAGARAVAAVGRAVAAGGGRVVVEGASRLFRRIWGVIGFADVAGVSFGEARA